MSNPFTPLIQMLLDAQLELQEATKTRRLYEQGQIEANTRFEQQIHDANLAADAARNRAADTMATILSTLTTLQIGDTDEHLS